MMIDKWKCMTFRAWLWFTITRPTISAPVIYWLHVWQNNPTVYSQTSMLHLVEAIFLSAIGKSYCCNYVYMKFKENHSTVTLEFWNVWWLWIHVLFFLTEDIFYVFLQDLFGKLRPNMSRYSSIEKLVAALVELEENERSAPVEQRHHIAGSGGFYHSYGRRR